MLTPMLCLALPEYEGSIEALVLLVERGEHDVTRLMTAVIAKACLDRLRNHNEHAHGDVADALALTARLVLLKSAALLPPPPAPLRDTADEEPAPASLEAALAEYRRFREAATIFRDRETLFLRSFPRTAPPPPVAPTPGLDGVTLDQLARIVRKALSRRPPEPPQTTPRERITLRGRIDELLRLLAARRCLSFAALIAAAASRVDVIVSFMAVLELIKRGTAEARQSAPFGDIHIVALTPPVAEDG